MNDFVMTKQLNTNYLLRVTLLVTRCKHFTKTKHKSDIDALNNKIKLVREWLIALCTPTHKLLQLQLLCSFTWKHANFCHVYFLYYTKNQS